MRNICIIVIQALNIVNNFKLDYLSSVAKKKCIKYNIYIKQKTEYFALQCGMWIKKKIFLIITLMIISNLLTKVFKLSLYF